MPRTQSRTAALEQTFERPNGVVQDFQTVKEMSQSIAARASEFRAMAGRLGELVAALDR